MLKKILLPFSLMCLTGCVKTFVVKPTSFESYTAHMSIQPSKKNGDYINVKITNKSAENLYIDWRTVKLQIGPNQKPTNALVRSKKSGKREQTITELAMISQNQFGVYNVYPKSARYSSLSSETSEHLFDVLTIAQNSSSSTPLVLKVSVCSGALVNGELPEKCQTPSTNWDTAVFKTKVQVEDLNQ